MRRRSRSRLPRGRPGERKSPGCGRAVGSGPRRLSPPRAARAGAPRRGCPCAAGLLQVNSRRGPSPEPCGPRGDTPHNTYYRQPGPPAAAASGGFVHPGEGEFSSRGSERPCSPRPVGGGWRGANGEGGSPRPESDFN